METPSRLPDGRTELRRRAQRVGQEDRFGEDAEETVAILLGQPGGLKGHRDLDPAVTGRRIRLTTRLTNRTLRHLASLDQTEEGPVGTPNGWGLQFSAGIRGWSPINRALGRQGSVDPAPY